MTLDEAVNLLQASKHRVNPYTYLSRVGYNNPWVKRRLDAVEANARIDKVIEKLKSLKEPWDE